jgi:hypothetical protein
MNANNRPRLHGMMTLLFLIAFGLGTNMGLAQTKETGTTSIRLASGLSPKGSSVDFLT